MRFTQKTEQFVDKNRNQLTYGLGGVALIILLIAGYKQLIVKPANDAAESCYFSS